MGLYAGLMVGDCRVAAMLYIVPSRSRPHNIATLIDAWDATRTHATLWVCVDDDDETLDEYRALQMPGWASLKVGPRMRLGPTLNYYAAKYVGDAQVREDDDIIGFMGDDHVPRTAGWDATISDVARNTGTCVMYGNDLIQGAALPTAVALTGDIVETLGYMVPPGAIHLYLDNAWKYIGESIGRLKYLPGVVIEHVHPVAGKADWDPGYVEVNGKHMYDHDGEVFEKWKASDAPAVIEKLKALIR